MHSLLYYCFPMVTLKSIQGQREKCSCCHWNVNSILAHEKLSLIKSYNTVQKYNIICMLENFLDSSANEISLLISGYHFLRAHHPGNIKKGGVYLYFKENLSLRQIETPYFSLYILCELTIKNKVGYIPICCSPSQTSLMNFL